MSYFSNTLAQALQASDKTQADIADSLGISQSMVSRWINNKTDLREETLVRLLSQIPTEHHKMLVESYLLDRCPEPFRHLIAFAQTVAPAVAESQESYLLSQLPDRTRKSITTLAALSGSNPALRRLFVDMERILTDPHASSAPIGPEEETHFPAEDDPAPTARPASVDQLLADARARKKARRAIS